jgi:hypothetical protein
MKKILIPSFAFALSSLLATGAVITLENSDTAVNTNYSAGPISVNFGSLNLTGGDKLVVSIGIQTTINNVGREWTSVTFDSVSMTEAARIGGSGNSPYQSGIYYLDNLSGLSATGSLTIDGSSLNARGATAFAWVLSGTAAGHGASGGATGTSTSLTTTANDSWVLAHATVAGTTVPTAQFPLTLGLTETNPYNAGSETSIGSGYQTVATSGTSLSPTFDVGDTTVAVEFTAVPEPSTILLLGALGSLTFLRRRR